MHLVRYFKVQKHIRMRITWVLKSECAIVVDITQTTTFKIQTYTQKAKETNGLSTGVNQIYSFKNLQVQMEGVVQVVVLQVVLLQRLIMHFVKHI